jgi:hypothetical protein
MTKLPGTYDPWAWCKSMLVVDEMTHCCPSSRKYDIPCVVEILYQQQTLMGKIKYREKSTEVVV